MTHLILHESLRIIEFDEVRDIAMPKAVEI